MTTDQIYSTPRDTIPEFVFDESVASVFGDMIQRSVPGYATTISTIGELAALRVAANTRCYDLGCSLGAATIAMRHGIRQPDCEIVAVDLSAPMLQRCSNNIAADSADTPVQVLQADICDVGISNASLVVLNFTLQFVPLAQRQALLEKIYAGLNPGGVLLLSEKITFDEPQLNQLNIDLHHRFKSANGYSDLEIAQKRSALENTLIPETLAVHQRRLQAVGFAASHPWYQCFNFMSMLAVK